jgi:hypothetical protein
MATLLARSAAAATLITAASSAAATALVYQLPPEWFWRALFAPAYPAWMLLLFFGLGTGTHNVGAHR